MSKTDFLGENHMNANEFVITAFDQLMKNVREKDAPNNALICPVDEGSEEAPATAAGAGWLRLMDVLLRQTLLCHRPDAPTSCHVSQSWRDCSNQKSAP